MLKHKALAALNALARKSGYCSRVALLVAYSEGTVTPEVGLQVCRLLRWVR